LLLSIFVHIFKTLTKFFHLKFMICLFLIATLSPWFMFFKTDSRFSVNKALNIFYFCFFLDWIKCWIWFNITQRHSWIFHYVPQCSQTIEVQKKIIKIISNEFLPHSLFWNCLAWLTLEKYFHLNLMILLLAQVNNRLSVFIQNFHYPWSSFSSRSERK
jgi:hypothetical protein